MRREIGFWWSKLMFSNHCQNLTSIRDMLLVAAPLRPAWFNTSPARLRSLFPTSTPPSSPPPPPPSPPPSPPSPPLAWPSSRLALLFFALLLRVLFWAAASRFLAKIWNNVRRSLPRRGTATTTSCQGGTITISFLTIQQVIQMVGHSFRYDGGEASACKQTSFEVASCLKTSQG